MSKFIEIGTHTILKSRVKGFEYCGLKDDCVYVTVSGMKQTIHVKTNNPVGFVKRVIKMIEE